MIRIASILIVCSLSINLSVSYGQTTAQPTDMGLQPYHDYHGGDIDHINLDNGNLTVTIPVLSYPQRGSSLRLDFALVFNGTGMSTTGIKNCQTIYGVQVCTGGWGGPSWQAGVSPFTTSKGIALYDMQDMASTLRLIEYTHDEGGSTVTNYYDQDVFDTPDGGSHPAVQTNNGQVSDDGTNIQAGFVFSPFSSNSDSISQVCTWDCSLPGVAAGLTVMSTRSGITYFGSDTSSNGPVRMDADGNYISGNGTALTDTVGRTIPFPSAAASPTPSQAAECTGTLPTSSVRTWTPPGYTNPFLFCYATVTLGWPAYLKNTWTETTSSVTILQSLVLPNGQAWTFGYQEAASNCPNSSVGSTNIGDLTSIIFPTGGTISYTYTCIQNPWPDYTTAVATRAVNANDGQGSHPWTYSYTTNQNASWITRITDPLQNDTVQTLTSGNTSTATNATRVTQTYAGSASTGKLLRTDTRVYPPQYATIGSFPLYPSSERTTLDNGMSSQTTYQYCCDLSFTSIPYGLSTPVAASYGKVTDVKVYDYAASGQGTLLRETSTNYLFQYNALYLSPGFLDLILTQTTYDGKGNQMAHVSNTYDGSPRAVSGIASLPGSQLSTPLYSVFGHATSQSKWLNTGGNPTTTTTYFDTGKPFQFTDPLGHTKATYYCTGSSPTSIPCSSSAYLGAVPTVISNPLGQQTSFTYRTDTGQLLTTTDPNGQTTTDAYSDSLNRLTSITYPDGGQTGIQYNDSGTIGVTVSQKLNSSTSKVIQANVDGLGREVTTILSDPSGYTFTSTSYDALGRMYQESTPYRTTNDTSYGLTTYLYDPLGRTITKTDSDGVNTQHWSYTGNSVTFADENKNQWTRTTDALGRVTTVLEPTGTSQTPASETDYGYDALNNLISVTQWGGASGSSNGRTRSFTYDSLSRLVQADNPEAGWICYGTTGGTAPNGSNCTEGYDADGNLLYKTDARNVVISYHYDGLNRLLSKSYSNDPANTPLSCYQYDSSSVTYGKGRLAAEWTQLPSAGQCTT